MGMLTVIHTACIARQMRREQVEGVIPLVETEAVPVGSSRARRPALLLDAGIELVV